MMRLRIVAQGATVLALVLGSFTGEASRLLFSFFRRAILKTDH